MDWTISNSKTPLDKPLVGGYGFVYLIEFIDGKKYIGKKNFFTNRKRKFGKKELALMTDKRLKKYEYVTKESNWKDYYSSNKDVVARVENGDDYRKHILVVAKSKKELTYLEESKLFLHRVLFNKSYYNDNIAGRFFTKDVSGWEN